VVECAAAEGEAIVREALAQADNPHHSTITCTAGSCHIKVVR